MKTFFTILFLFGCGIVPIKPIPPIGCTDLIPECLCDNQGQCIWNWVCVVDTDVTG